MIFNVQMLAFMDNEIRPVNVPDNEITGIVENDLERIFYYGQNDFQPLPHCCSVSVGDVVELGGKFYIVRGIGWAEISADDLKLYKAMDRRDRQFSEYARPHLIPVLVELDDNGESTGTVLPFCSYECCKGYEGDRTNFRQSADVAANFPAGTICTTCGKAITLA